jgi:predicted nucleic acid-binding protein
MVYFDTNVLVYIFALGIDTLKQRDISIKLFDEAIKNRNLVLSEITLYEFAFTCKKLKEDPITIQKNLKFLSRYVKATNINIHKRVIDIFESTSLYNSSFDIFHLAFCEYNNCKLVTFDKGFRKLQETAKIEIEIK